MEILERLDKSYAVNALNQLDADLVKVLDYKWKIKIGRTIYRRVT